MINKDGSLNETSFIRIFICLVALLIGIIALRHGAPPQSKQQATKENKPVEAKRDVVYNSSWDGSVQQVERYLQQTLKDPDSFDAISWSPVLKTPTGGFAVRCKYRAKNSFGGYVIEQFVFFMDADGKVISATPYKN